MFQLLCGKGVLITLQSYKLPFSLWPVRKM